MSDHSIRIVDEQNYEVTPLDPDLREANDSPLLYPT